VPNRNVPCCLVFIVEDDPSIREALQEAIEAEGYPVRVASNGEEALLLLKGLKVPSLILTDLMMPKMNDYEFIEMASNTHTIASIPIVVVSANPEHKAIAEMLDARKIKGLVKKPVDLKYLMSLVHTHCGPSPIKKKA